MSLPLSASWPGHLLDLAQWDALPEDTSRQIELAEGVLQVAPKPILLHQRIVMRLAARLDDAADGRWEAFPGVEIVIEDAPAATVRAPDVVLVRPDISVTVPRWTASEVLAAIEVLSPGSRRLDRIVKLHEYADAGIPTYLVVDPGPPVELTEFELVDGAYRQVALHRGAAELRLGVTLDLDALT
ncbi:Uma2 family endonuclease [Actinomycetospora termitidis]|uniref:Uma2 family endonuclease n=1 Tax=Actinomycetospora termitidis TaxID=3053470 RepID=A0ABT7MFP9_9PSEU|nr:Uma2 family endonuclease [Actinomycetospora sp. Odt1-22]MDL5159501.1 Uma2 family endonuclease [Actinomycetospora sp. Odt1-22]